MEYFSTHTFIHRHGFESFKKMIEMSNDGCQLKEIAEAVGLSMSQICRYREMLFMVKYIPKIGTKKYMEEYAEKDHMRGEAKESFILKLVDAK